MLITDAIITNESTHLQLFREISITSQNMLENPFGYQVEKQSNWKF